MGGHILNDNEKSNAQKRIQSLHEMWTSLSEDEQKYGIEKAKTYINDTTTSWLTFDRNIILRVIIGPKGKKCLKAAMDNALPTTRILIWEPEKEVFLADSILEDLSDIIRDERVSVIIGNEDPEYIENIIKENVNDSNLNHRSIVAYGEYLNEDNEDTMLFINIFKKVAEEIGFLMASRKQFKQAPYENLLYAISRLNNNYTVYQLFDQIPVRDIPVIIVAAGPSLMKNCKELLRAKGKAIIIAVSHSMKTLSDEGICPDLVAVTDAGESAIFMDFDFERENILLCSVFGGKNCQRLYEGKLIYHGFDLCEDLFSVDRTRSEIRVHLDTGSVATDAFGVFMAAGFRTFILVGQDLAYDEYGHTHTGMENERSVYEQNNYYEMVEGVLGERVKTRYDWSLFREYYENSIENNPEIQVIDATEGGALIKGSKVMMLRDAIDNYCVKEYPVRLWIGQLKKGDDKELDEIKRWFETSLENCRYCGKYLKEAIELNESIGSVWNDSGLWDESFKAECRRYDVLYKQIMEGFRGDLLRHYCTYYLEEYVENALTVEGDDNAMSRLLMERDMFVFLYDKVHELVDYISGLSIS